MNGLAETAEAFVEVAHRIVWATVATVDRRNRPRTRILHPYWEWDGERLVGWCGTFPTPLKRAHLRHSPYTSLTYWTPDHDTATADCETELVFEDDVRERVWNRFKELEPPLGYDPAEMPPWKDGPTGQGFAVLRFEPWRLKVLLPGPPMGSRPEPVQLVWSR